MTILRVSELSPVKNCPFCGGEASDGYDGELRYIRCKDCRARGKTFDVTKESGNNLDVIEKCIQAWNTRVNQN